MSYKHLTWLPGRRRIHRFAPGNHPPGTGMTLAGAITAVIRTPDETTVITEDAGEPAGTDPSSGPWSTFRVSGAIPHDVTGVLSRMSAALADAGIPIFVVSTFDTDYVMVPTERTRDTTEALTRAGYQFDHTA